MAQGTARSGHAWPPAAALLLAVVLAAAPAQVRGEISVSRTLGSYMVLQRAPQSARVYGSGNSGERGTVAFGHFAAQFVVDQKGQWEVSLPPTQAGGPYNITVTPAQPGQNATVLTDVLFGDVWFCGGQSNMCLGISYAFNGTEEMAELTEANYPTVRVFDVATTNQSDTPFPDLIPKQIAIPWKPLNPSVGWQFSAVCWFFGREMYRQSRQQVPLGLITNCWGGSAVGAWSSPQTVARCPNGTFTGADVSNTSNTTSNSNSTEPAVAVTAAEEKTVAVASGTMTTAAAAAAEEGSGKVSSTYVGTPSCLWNTMVVPFLRMRLAGFLWYQGEANVGRGLYKGAQYYSCAFPAMIQDWRQEFDLPNAPFVFAQLCAYCNNINLCNATSPIYRFESFLPELRIAQLSALQLPNVGWTVTDDLGDMLPPGGSIHPRLKQPVGQRLARSAQAVIANLPGPKGGPLFRSAAWARSNNTVIVTVDAAAPLRLIRGQCPEGIQPAFCDGAGFEVASNATHWVPVPQSAVQLGPEAADVTVRSPLPQGQRPFGVRYKFADWPVTEITDATGLPLSVFVATAVTPVP